MSLKRISRKNNLDLVKQGTIILICGLPGSGKSTLAKKLEIERNAMLINSDEWILRIIKSRSDTEEVDRLRNPIEELLLELAIKLTLKGNNIILDNGFWTISDRKKYFELIKKFNINIELHFLSTSKDLILKRLKVRNSETLNNNFEIDIEKMEKWIKIFEIPTNEEIERFDYFKKYDQI